MDWETRIYQHLTEAKITIRPSSRRSMIPPSKGTKAQRKAFRRIPPVEVGQRGTPFHGSQAAIKAELGASQAARLSRRGT